MAQMQEGEQQEEAKKPQKNVLGKWFYWFTCITGSLLSFFMIGLTVNWLYRGDWWQAFMFVLTGVGFYILLCAWQPGKLRIAGIVGSLLWSVIAWSIGYTYETANVLLTPRMGPFAYQFELIYGASVPFALLFFVFILLLNRDLVGK